MKIAKLEQVCFLYSIHVTCIQALLFVRLCNTVTNTGIATSVEEVDAISSFHVTRGHDETFQEIIAESLLNVKECISVFGL